jgi:hypothetical protein
MYSWGGIEMMPGLIKRLAQLKSLKVELPKIITGRKPSWWLDGMMVEYMDLFAGNGVFGCLTSCRLPNIHSGYRVNLGTSIIVYQIC